MSYEERGQRHGTNSVEPGQKALRQAACMCGMLGESWDGGGVVGAPSRVAADMIREAARWETLHLGPAPRLVDSDLPLPIVGELAMADDGWDPSSDMPGAQQALACDATTTRQHCWTAKPLPCTNLSPLASPAAKRARRCPITSCPGISPPAAVVG